MKQYYIDTFLIDRPRNGINSPQSRLMSALKLNDELAEYFKDRAQIEDTYAKSLLKLSKKTYISNKPALGTFSPLWEMLHVELSRLASIHNEYASIINEQVERPLRMSILEDLNYADAHRLEDSINKLARDFEELDSRIQKLKKNTKNEAKVAEQIKLKQEKLDEWYQSAPDYLQKLQNVEENRLEIFKSTVQKFEKLQQTHAEQIIELTGNVMTAATDCSAEEEIKTFCSAYGAMKPPTSAVATESTAVSAGPAKPASETSLNTHEPMPVLIPEPSVSSNSNIAPSINKKEKRRFFSSLSIRRKPKSSIADSKKKPEVAAVRQRSGSNTTASFVLESSSSSSFRSIHVGNHPSSRDAAEEGSSQATTNDRLQQLNKSTSMGNLSAGNNDGGVQSFTFKEELLSSSNGIDEGISTTTTTASPPLIVVDDEGYSIPPGPAPWPAAITTLANASNSPSDTHTLSESLLDMDDLASDAGSLLSNNPRLRVDIRSEAIKDEDASKSAVALSRVSTLLKEKSPSGGSRRLRGRREARATQLYSVIEQQIPDTSNLSTSTEKHATTSMLTSSTGDLSLETATAGFTEERNTDSNLTNPFDMSPQSAVKENKNTSTIQFYVNETIFGHLKGGQVEHSVSTGTINIQYSADNEETEPAATCWFTLRSRTPLESFEATNTDIVLSVKPDGNSDEDDNSGYNYSFEIDMLKLRTLQLLDTRQVDDGNDNSTTSSASMCCIQYQKQLSSLPLIVKPLWKCDADKSRLLIKYHKNNHFIDQQGTFTLDNVIFVTNVTGQPQNAMSIPSGELIVQQHPTPSRMRWMIGSMAEEEKKESVIKAQFSTLDIGTSQPIAVRFESIDSASTDLIIHKADMGSVINVTTFKTIKSGKYIADV